MKTVIIFILMLLNVNIFASVRDTKNPWTLESTNFYYENDLIFNSDDQYTSGIKLSNIYSMQEYDFDWMKIPFFYSEVHSHYMSIGFSQEIFTPKDTISSTLVTNDRPYAGWSYISMGMHESSADALTSLSLEIGMVGKSSLGEISQKTIHKLRGLAIPNGWDNQLRNELGINLLYQKKWKFVPDSILGVESDIIPFAEVSLGNVRTHARAGGLMRIGTNIPKDFGSSSMNIGGENSMPLMSGALYSEKLSFTLNFVLAGTAVARDIFLDGNSFVQSHSVEKEPFFGFASAGMSVRYKHYSFEYVLTTVSKQFELQNGNHKYGGIIFSYFY